MKTLAEIRAAGMKLGQSAPPVSEMPAQQRTRLRMLLAPHVERERRAA